MQLLSAAKNVFYWNNSEVFGSLNYCNFEVLKITIVLYHFVRRFIFAIRCLLFYITLLEDLLISLSISFDFAVFYHILGLT